MGDVTTDTLNALALDVENTLADALAATLTATTAATNTQATVLTLKRTTSGDMADNFGPILGFQIRDSAGVDNTIAQIMAYRGTVDNTGYLDMRTAIAGALSQALVCAPTLVSTYRNTQIRTGVLTAGIGTTTRGAVAALYGAGGNTAGYLLTYSRNGTPWYWWAEDDGTARISAAAPVNNDDGYIIGLQF